MSKLKYLIIISILFFSCQNNERESLINEFNAQREKNGLSSFDKNLKLDSTLYVKTDENYWNLINYIATYKKLRLDKNDTISNFGKIDFYSNSNKKLFKIVYYNKNKDGVKLVSEQDRFYRKLNDTIEIYLNHNYNYHKNQTIYSIDSLPTKLFIEKNQKKLNAMFDYAKRNNLELCGTSANEILSKGFPKRNTIINYSKFIAVKTELNK
ncbi:hypothetical protein [Flavobacterium polysaccharolyticum]|uniref:Lipoprotein n=1 Tax=Flavobacterium polysaccharolyticum TaxID=3133148 RepID=A0ABU9NMS2_9FLAO